MFHMISWSQGSLQIMTEGVTCSWRIFENTMGSERSARMEHLTLQSCKDGCITTDRCIAIDWYDQCYFTEKQQVKNLPLSRHYHLFCYRVEVPALTVSPGTIVPTTTKKGTVETFDKLDDLEYLYVRSYASSLKGCLANLEDTKYGVHYQKNSCGVAQKPHLGYKKSSSVYSLAIFEKVPMPKKEKKETKPQRPGNIFMYEKELWRPEDPVFYNASCLRVPSTFFVFFLVTCITFLKRF